MTKEIKIGNMAIGGSNPTAIQSMTNTKTANVASTIAQIKELERYGCDIVRCTVPDEESAIAIKEIKKNISIPLVADIHFDYKLAILALENGADKIRINPGNIGGDEGLQQVINCAKKYNKPIRIGVNSGSNLPNKTLVETALEYIAKIESLGFYDLVISVKSSNTQETIDSNLELAKKTNYPLHIGVTEAGLLIDGVAKNAIAMAKLLENNIGDTIRVTLSSSPNDEIMAGKAILRVCGKPVNGVEVISCPTCGRTNCDVFSIAKEIQDKTLHIKENVKIAVMGCIVNGPGEAKDADIAVCCGDKKGAIYINGIYYHTVDENSIVEEIIKIDKLCKK